MELTLQRNIVLNSDQSSIFKSTFNDSFQKTFCIDTNNWKLTRRTYKLLKTALKKNYNPVVSIFVNPLQFGPNEDLDKYPRSLERDLEILEENNCHGVFIPSQSEILKNIESLIAPFANKLCGKSRPGHFDGVITIVNRLFELINPDACVFGMKDFQQQLIIKQLIKQKKYQIKFLSASTERDEKGLALSSRNNYLSENETIHASLIFKFLNEIKNDIELSYQKNTNLSLSDLNLIQKKFQKKIEKEGFKIDYLDISDSETLEEIKSDTKFVLIAIAVFYKEVRLIDNLILDLTSFS